MGRIRTETETRRRSVRRPALREFDNQADSFLRERVRIDRIDIFVKTHNGLKHTLRVRIEASHFCQDRYGGIQRGNRIALRASDRHDSVNNLPVAPITIGRIPKPCLVNGDLLLLGQYLIRHKILLLGRFNTRAHNRRDSDHTSIALAARYVNRQQEFSS